jgi:muramoyltetrapeptide carboxypeptidase
MVVKLIGVVAPASRLDRSLAERVRLVAGEIEGTPEVFFHPQCFQASGHFAGEDSVREQAFLDVANDPHFHAVWIGRGGYGSNRIAERVLPQLNDYAREKVYLGYSDAGFLLAGLYRAGCKVAHGPMPADLARVGGEAAVTRALAWLVHGDMSGLEPSLEMGVPAAAFNMVVLSHLIGTALEPDLTDHVLMLEEVSEHLYRIDRTMFHLTATPSIRKVRGIRLGRVSDVIPNDVDFGESEEDIVRHWCEVSSIPYLGRADIGHDADNKIVPFGV